MRFSLIWSLGKKIRDAERWSLIGDYLDFCIAEDKKNLFAARFTCKWEIWKMETHYHNFIKKLGKLHF